MVQIHSSVANHQFSLNSWFHVFVNYFFLEQNVAWMNFMILMDFWGCFLKKCLWFEKVFWWFFGRFPKNGFTSLTKKWNQDFEVPGLNCFLQTDRVKIAVTVLLLLLDDESCFEKDGYQTCSWKSLISVKISEIRVFPIDCHAALSKTKSQKRVVILRETKRSRRIYWKTI